VQLEVHLGEGLLHEQHLARGALEQGVAMAQNAANRANGLRRPERASVRPGTPLTWRALTKQTSNPRRSKI
jgi:hypothetical protein